MTNFATKAARLVRLRAGRPIVDAANRHRDRAEWIEAAMGYARALDRLPWREDLRIQLGNCLKEYGDYPAAIRAYGLVTGGAYRTEAAKQIEDARRRGSGLLPFAFADGPENLPPAGAATPTVTADARDLPNRIRIETVEPRRWLGSLGADANAPRPRRGLQQPSIVFDQVGALTLTRDGAIEPLLAGVVAIRARIAALARLDAVELWLGEGGAARRILSHPVRAVERGALSTRLHVANIWIDSAALPPGRHWLAIRAGGRTPEAGLFVNVAAPGVLDMPASDAFVPSMPDTGDPTEAIVAAPAQARSASRSLFDRPVRSILALRVDQLGDVSASLAALVRLRAVFPDARLSVLVQPGVKAMVEASRIADEILTIALPYNAVTERRYLPPEEEARISAACAERRFDLAIDLSPGDEVRPLLLLTGATYLVGFNPDRFTYLDFGIGLRSRDKVNQLERISHAAAVMTLVEALAVAAAPSRAAVPRQAPSDAALAANRLEAGGYVVLHSGARHAINRWPVERFLQLAERFLAETALTVVLFTDDPADRRRPALGDGDRVRFLDPIDADTFDAILSNARLLIGNDSGPKHLAATRGVPTVSIHVDRLNWNEWGQDGRGTILSKRVPCTGCGLNDIDLCGRDAVCVRAIGVDAVMAAARAYV